MTTYTVEILADTNFDVMVGDYGVASKSLYCYNNNIITTIINNN